MSGEAISGPLDMLAKICAMSKKALKNKRVIQQEGREIMQEAVQNRVVPERPVPSKICTHDPTRKRFNCKTCKREWLLKINSYIETKKAVEQAIRDDQAMAAGNIIEQGTNSSDMETAKPSAAQAKLAKISAQEEMNARRVFDMQAREAARSMDGALTEPRD